MAGGGGGSDGVCVCGGGGGWGAVERARQGRDSNKRHNRTGRKKIVFKPKKYKDNKLENENKCFAED